MPIAEVKPEVNFTPQVQLPQAQPDNYKGLTYDNNQVPLISLAAYVEGAPWTVTYYAQVLGAHNDLKPLDPNLAAEYQSYSRIDQMEIRVQNELDGQTNGTSQFTKTTGSALVYGFIEPNVNDYFTAETAHQRWGLFIVTAVDRHTWRRESVFTIQYQLVDFTYRLTQEMESLKLKTTTEYVFSKDRLIEGFQTPYLKTDQYQKLVDLRQSRQMIGDYYLNAFINNECKTLVIPGQPMKRIYDSFLVDFVLSTFGYTEFNKCLYIKQLPKSGDTYLEQPQFWQAILKRDRNLIEFGNKTMMVAATGVFPRTSYIKTMYSARMDMVVYPYRPDMSTISGQELQPLPVFRECLKPTTSGSGVELTEAEKTWLMDNKPVLAYPPAHLNGYYVLSRNFYDNNSGQLTVLEIMTRDYLEARTLDLNQLTFLIKLYPKMPRLEQFYFGPLLLALMKYADKNMY